MFSKTLKISRSAFTAALMFMLIVGLSACDGAKPPALMKAVKQFDSDETRDEHIKHMRINHMDELLHKRDLTVIKGIRTKKNSLKECINCHVPEKHNGEILRHTNPEHFCSTCHGYVAQELDCFQCHVDHPVSSNSTATAPNDSIHNTQAQAASDTKLLATNTRTEIVSELKNKSVEIAKSSTTTGESTSE